MLRVLSPAALLFTFMTLLVPPALLADRDTTMKKLEHLLNLEIIPGAMRITVISTGCTSARDFSVETNSNGETAIYRIHPDFCRRAPRPVTLTLGWNPSVDNNKLPQIRNTVVSPATAR